MIDPSTLIPFIAGFTYGITTTVVGQPFDTIKTRLQTGTSLKSSSAINIGKDIFRAEGIMGLYRGGLSVSLGGGAIRSTQFGVYNYALQRMRNMTSDGKPIDKDQRLFSCIDYQVVLAGFAGGLGRGLVEGPFEYVKVRKQVNQNWKLTEIFQGSGATIFRNCFLFSSFMIYIDLAQFFFGGFTSSFVKGAVCSNLAWLTIWPLDVCKSQLQSGNEKYKGKSYLCLLKDIYRSGLLFRGLLPGLARSTFANGFSMVAYNYTEKFLNDRLDRG